jgi:hypothetical protein
MLPNITHSFTRGSWLQLVKKNINSLSKENKHRVCMFTLKKRVEKNLNWSFFFH